MCVCERESVCECVRRGKIETDGEREGDDVEREDENGSPNAQKT